MVWTCNSCGKLGEREGIAEAGWCHRAGLATMKGIMQCCNCMLACGWDGYDEHGCRACIRTAGRRLPIGSARRAASEVALEKAFSSLPQQPKPNVPTFQNSLPALEHVKRIVVFEFDGVLFRTPKRPNWWPYNSYHGMIESLLPPAVPITPSDSWWNSDVVAQAKAAFEDPDTWSVLITFRGDAFKSRIHNLLRSQGISFNETRFRPLTPFLSQLGATYTGAAGYGSLVPNFKLHPRTEQEKHAMVVLGEILSRCSLAAALLELWACSNLNNNLAGSLSQVLRSTRAREVQIHGVDAPQHAAGTPTAAELAAMVQARALEKKLSRKGNVIPAGLLHGSSRTGARQRRHVLQSVREDAPEGSGAPARRVKARQVAVRTANWPVDVYAVRRKAAQWTFESSKKMDSRPFNFQLAVAWDEGEREEDSEEEEEEEEEDVEVIEDFVQTQPLPEKFQRVPILKAPYDGLRQSVTPAGWPLSSAVRPISARLAGQHPDATHNFGAPSLSSRPSMPARPQTANARISFAGMAAYQDARDVNLVFNSKGDAFELHGFQSPHVSRPNSAYRQSQASTTMHSPAETPRGTKHLLLPGPAEPTIRTNQLTEVDRIKRAFARTKLVCPVNVIERALVVPQDRCYAKCVEQLPRAGGHLLVDPILAAKKAAKGKKGGKGKKGAKKGGKKGGKKKKK